MTLDDMTEIVHSEILENGSVKVYIEKPDEKDCFHSMVCMLPGYEIKDVSGFSDAEISKYVNIIASSAHLIMEFAGTGGVDNASGF